MSSVFRKRDSVRQLSGFEVIANRTEIRGDDYRQLGDSVDNHTTFATVLASIYYLLGIVEHLTNLVSHHASLLS